MLIRAFRDMTRDKVCAALDAFSPPYAVDFEHWLAASPASRARIFGEILRRWQATRPRVMRRTRGEQRHSAPYLEDLLALAAEPVSCLGDLDVRTVRTRGVAQHRALLRLWDIFANLTVEGSATCVGISKGVLLATDGRIGPCLDSTVRAKIGCLRPAEGRDWIDVLDAVADDIAAFERRNGAAFIDCVPVRFRHLAIGRLYDMALGPGASVPDARPRPSSPPTPPGASGTTGRGRSFEEVWDCVRSRGTFVAVSTRGTEYHVTAKTNRAGQKVLVARPGSGAIYVHADCFGDDITCQGTRAGGIYNGSPSVWDC